VDHVEICADCHKDKNLTKFADATYYDVDHDGDGTVEGLQDEVHGLMDELAELLPVAEGHVVFDPHDDPDATWTLAELKAAFNYKFVYYDHSYGIHNPPYTVGLLHASIEELVLSGIPGVIVAIDDVPNDQGNMVRIVWEGFGGDGRAIDPVEKYIVKRLDEYVGADTTWTTAGEATAHGALRYALDVPTLYNTTTAAAFESEFRVVALTVSGDVTESIVGGGESVDNLIPEAPTSVAALADGGVSLSWEASVAPDVNFYRIYRATTQNFTPSEANQIATTVEREYVDAVTNPGDYYYKIAAEDFNGNLGEFSTEVDAHVTGIEGSELPTEYALAQNYPNPFNPTTTIKFQIKEAGHVSLVIYDHIGREVLNLVDQPMSPGYHSVTVGADRLASGIYFYRIRANEFTATRKMLLLK
jgi:hypothetical protein